MGLLASVREKKKSSFFFQIFFLLSRVLYCVGKKRFSLTRSCFCMCICISHVHVHVHLHLHAHFVPSAVLLLLPPAQGYHLVGRQCMPDNRCHENTCNGHGLCYTQEGGAAVMCVCDAGFVTVGNDFCSACASRRAVYPNCFTPDLDAEVRGVDGSCVLAAASACLLLLLVRMQMACTPTQLHILYFFCHLCVTSCRCPTPTAATTRKNTGVGAGCWFADALVLHSARAARHTQRTGPAFLEPTLSAPPPRILLSSG